ncbi:transcription antitermination factor NusB [Nannocystis radixulma]|uniref:Transcription antitermination factor NusB n=1 Tax=Nannocystis radixulma TaxID=2995305 RepID=A0ABT5BBI4_9BACT|nr:transcription antitermination factor NusB [Nannocystis radixulma]MDC0671494.1 transcription antitermination factor NusB [Nannocystis radixulma]
MPRNPITARVLAVQTLRQIDQRRGFSNRILAEQLERHPDLERRERGLTTTLVYGVLRHRGRLDALIDAAAVRPKNLSARAREIARVAAFELRELQHPPHAAISQALGLATALDPTGALARPIHAILATIDRDGAAIDARLAAGKPLDVLANRWSIPRWLAGRWLATLGPDVALARARALASPPAVELRVDLSRTTAEEVAAALREADAKAVVEAIADQPQALRVRGGGELVRHPLYERGLFAVQALGAQRAALSLAPCPGEHVLDACAGMGTKSLQLAELMHRRGRLVAADASELRLGEHAGLRRRGELDAPGLEFSSVVADLAAPEPQPGVDEATYDAVLLDAPCTGLGNLARHPELRATVQYDDIAACAALQRRLLDRCRARVRPGGRLVYAVCSLEPEEGPLLVRAACDAGLFTREHEETWTPETHHTDGFYLARLRPT